MQPGDRREALLLHAAVVTPFDLIQDGALHVVDGRIAAIGSAAELAALRERVAVVYDLTGCWCLPGFIDVHVHGGGGADAMEADAGALRTMVRFHARGGTTALLPTTLTAPFDTIMQAIGAVHRMRRESGWEAKAVLGVHVEGPFLSREWAGAQDPSLVRGPEPGEVDALVAQAGDVRIVSAAPEVEGCLELGRKATQRGIVPSIAHSGAYYDDVARAVAAGYRSVTHLYCAMPPWRNVRGQKSAGIVESAFLFDELFVELVMDGNHVPPHLVQLAYKVKGAERICMVTDAIRFAGMPAGVYEMGGRPVRVTQAAARLADGSGNAGSVATMEQCFRYAVKECGIPLRDAVRSATATPAELLGIADVKGRLAAGRAADITVLDQELRVVLTMVAGQVAYAHPRLSVLAQERSEGGGREGA